MKTLAKKTLAAALSLSLLSSLPVSIDGANSFKALSAANAADASIETDDNRITSEIEIAGTKITSENADDVLGDGVFSYDNASSTLTIKGDYENSELDTFLINSKSRFILNIADNSTINIPEASFIRSTGNLFITGGGKLTLRCLDGIELERGCLLDIRCVDLDIYTDIAAFSIFRDSPTDPGAKSILYIIFSNINIKSDYNDNNNSTMIGFNYYNFSNCIIKEPVNYKTENYQIREEDGSKAVNFIINPFFVAGDINLDGKFNISDVVVLYRCIYEGIPSDRNAYMIRTIGDVYNTGDGLTKEDFFVLYAWWRNNSTPYYGAIPELSYTVNSHKDFPGDIETTGEYLNTSRSTLRGAYLALEDTPEQPIEYKWGDTNCDGEVKMNDAVLLMQALSNADRFGIDGSDPDHITALGQYYGDVESPGSGISPNDALQIQKYLIKLVDSLEPET